MGYASLIMKATRLCNLRCTYCNSWRTGPNQIMGFPVLVRTVAAALSDPEHETVAFVWHGGETTVLPVRFYEKAMVVQSRMRRPGQRIRNSIQTNGTRLTAAWVDFFRRNAFSVGVSIDGPAEVHDQVRRYGSGRGSFQDVLRGIRALQDAAVPFGVLMVVGEDTLAGGPDRLFDFLLEHRIRDCGLLAARPANQPQASPGTPAAPYVDPGRMSAFLIGLYDRWRSHGDERIRIRELEAVRNRLAGDHAGVCTLSGSCIGHQYMIEPNGDVAHCDHFLGDAAYVWGNILRQDFASLRAGLPMARARAARAAALDQMSACPDFAVCNGWCPHERYLSERHDPHHTPGCCGLSGLISHMRQFPVVREPALPIAPVWSGEKAAPAFV